MNGADYVAVNRLTNLDGDVLAAPGEPCTKVDPKSLPHLLEAGDIRRKEERRESKKQEAPAKPEAKLEEPKPLEPLEESGFVGEE